MRLSLFAALLAAVGNVELGNASPLRRASTPILLGNDDGWAEANIRAFYQVLKQAGYNPLISSPTENRSGFGSLSTTPKSLTSPGEFDSIPAGAPAEGHNATDDHIWYVNAYPADGVTFGLNNLSSTFFGGPPALVVTGPNVGGNAGLTTLFSGTVGAASAAAQAGVPAIAFSGATGSQRAYTELVPGDYSFIYASAAQRLTAALLASGAPYLPANTALNVNFPAAGPGTDCESADDVKFVMSRVHTVLGLPVDVKTCGSSSLPSESSVVGTSGGCFASVSVFSSSTKLDVGKSTQQIVLDKLSNIFTCLPS
ncbi:5'/3'-nucleotidase sure family protein [Punctularia strigosozonata HHB-11173 SS5]|uniref:5'/3'-nucleotidase sure family protein n=1 Tax=Punctularia strigosozonata (strain HHB-11173) TaxID=741275 RepID=UPI000441810E|nr:5'/3'-nucleotidase sure family protein [Punctularia strigosozonata HHB-11173 SS5]EIN14711.1 5'/3'-nucleotidase sure family protein [Punctularia strigosozonata HHB-11173 SS5]